MPSIKELKQIIQERAQRLTQAEEAAPPLPPGNDAAGTVLLRGTWHSVDGGFTPGPDAAMVAVYPGRRSRAIREMPEGDFKLVMGEDPFELV